MNAGLVLVSLLLALVLVGVLLTKTLNSSTHPGAAPGPVGAQSAASGTPRQQAARREDQVRDEVTKAIDAAGARRQQAEKP